MTTRLLFDLAVIAPMAWELRRDGKPWSALVPPLLVAIPTGLWFRYHPAPSWLLDAVLLVAVLALFAVMLLDRWRLP